MEDSSNSSGNEKIQTLNINIQLPILEGICHNEYFGVRLGFAVNGVPTYSPVLDSYWTEFKMAATRREIVAKTFTMNEIVYVDIVVVSGKDMPVDQFVNTDPIEAYLEEKKTNATAMLHFASFVKVVAPMSQTSVSTEIVRLKLKLSGFGNANRKKTTTNES